MNTSLGFLVFEKRYDMQENLVIVESPAKAKTAGYLTVLYMYAARILVSWELPTGWVSWLIVALMTVCIAIQFGLYPADIMIRELKEGSEEEEVYSYLSTLNPEGNWPDIFYEDTKLIAMTCSDGSDTYGKSDVQPQCHHAGLSADGRRLLSP